MNELCTDEHLNDLIAVVAADEKDVLTKLEGALKIYSSDARLHFLYASVLTGKQKLILAHDAFQKAVDLDPDFHLARFQFGFFLLTSGEVQEAISVWEKLGGLPDNNYLKLFYSGLRHLINDQMREGEDLIVEGIKLNNENLPLNEDMLLLLSECKKQVRDEQQSYEGEGDTMTSMLLRQHTQRAK